MRALSVWQPWATLWMLGLKQYETRHWSTDHRGPLAVHAAQRVETEFGQPMRGYLDEVLGRDWATTISRGAVLGMGVLTKIPRSSQIFHRLEGTELMLGNWAPGRYGWLLERRRQLAEPLPWCGRQGLFDVPDDKLAGLL